MREISPGIFVESDQRGANYGAILTDEGSIIIDTPIVPKQAVAFREELRQMTGGKPFLYIINTDHHRGHIVGNQYFMPTPVVAHDIAWKHMKGYGDNFKQRVIDSFKKEPEIQAQFTSIQIVVPKITFSHRLDIVRGGRDLRIIKIGGHTAATSVIWLPNERILFVGDAVWVDQHPYMAQANSKEWLDGLTYIRKFKADQIVPGRGPVCGRDATERMSEYIRYMRARVRTFHRQNHSRQETVQTVLREVVGWFPISPALKSKTESQIKQGIGRIWNEMEKAARAKDKSAPEVEIEEPGDE
ncbi:MAG: Metallo-beta-lactamase superfamily protein [Chloroflexi bacterium ADurb.Bin325]|nr:MAG: Metallo-beta-lactamase superfamily protein [Chloroflexi bacterium ADurb.Bin325]